MTRLSLLTLLLAAGLTAAAQPQLSYSPLITGLSNPIDIVNAGDNSNRLFVVQRNGDIALFSAALAPLGTFLTVTGISTAGEGGLLSMAFHPSYETNGYFYVYYTLPDNSLQIERYQVSANPNVADPSSGQVVLNIPHPVNTNHNGGKLLFGADGYLYLGTGDGGGGGDPNNNAQNGGSLLGKMLRLNVTTTVNPPLYTIPPSNPYIADPAVADEIWAMGLRNPFRWSFDRNTQDMWLADVGQGAFEEVNFQPAASTGGSNYGWRCYEANAAYNTAGCQPSAAYTSPIFSYTHDAVAGGSSITGGFVYRGPDYPALNGYYICADFVSGNQWVINPNGAGGWNVFQQDDSGFPGNIVAYGEAEDGTLYAASLTGNTIYKVDLAFVLPLTLSRFTGKYEHNNAVLDWATAAEQGLAYFDVEYSADGQHFTFAGRVKAFNRAGGASYQFSHAPALTGRIWYRLRMTDMDGSERLSGIITLSADAPAGNRISANPVTDGRLRMSLAEPFDELLIIHTGGAVLRRIRLKGQTGALDLALEGLSRGIYILQLKSERHTDIHKLVIQ